MGETRHVVRWCTEEMWSRGARLGMSDDKEARARRKAMVRVKLEGYTW